MSMTMIAGRLMPDPISVQFTIPGTPQPQGSKSFNPKTGRSFEDNKKLMPWRRDALACAADAKRAVVGDAEEPLFTGPVQVTVVAYFGRPASHYGTGRNAGKLKPSAPFWYSVFPDADKICRALGDVLEQAGIVINDSRIVSWDASKVYGQPGMRVTVSPAEEVLVAHVEADEPALIEDVDLIGALIEAGGQHG